MLLTVKCKLLNAEIQGFYESLLAYAKFKFYSLNIDWVIALQIFPNNINTIVMVRILVYYFAFCYMLREYKIYRFRYN